MLGALRRVLRVLRRAQQAIGPLNTHGMLRKCASDSATQVFTTTTETGVAQYGANYVGIEELVRLHLDGAAAKVRPFCGKRGFIRGLRE